MIDFFKRFGRNRGAPKRRGKFSGVVMTDENGYKSLCETGYRPLKECPEVQMCVNVYADLIGAMTLHLLANTDEGDKRIKNGLSRRLDIAPHPYLIHQNFYSTIVRTMMIEGNQITLPVFKNGQLEALEPLRPSEVTLEEQGRSYRVRKGGQLFEPGEVLNFCYNPDPDKPWQGRGCTFALSEIIEALLQTNATKNALMKNPSPSLIVKVDGLSEEMQSPDGRRKLGDKYTKDIEAGRPWMIPAETMDITTVKPLTLNDLAIKTSLEIDKRTVAAMMRIPPFLVGVGEFKPAEYDWFVTTPLMVVARIIEQEMSRGLIYSDDMYVRFSSRSLLNYDISKIISAGTALVDRMAMDRNELREWLGFTPDPRMKELLGLENFVPTSKLGDQKKLRQGDDEKGEEKNAEEDGEESGH